MNAHNKPKSEQKSVSMCNKGMCVYKGMYTNMYIYSACVNKGIHNVGVCTFERDSLHVQR